MSTSTSERSRPNIDHPALGRLAYEGRLDWYTTSLPLGDERIELHIHCEGAEGEPPALEHAARIASRLEALRAAAADRAALDMLKLKNNIWLDDDEAEVSAEEFKRRMALNSIVVNPDGSATFYHADGDLFWGHSIVVYMDPDGSFRQAEIAG